MERGGGRGGEAEVGEWTSPPPLPATTFTSKSNVNMAGWINDRELLNVKKPTLQARETPKWEDSEEEWRNKHTLRNEIFLISLISSYSSSSRMTKKHNTDFRSSCENRHFLQPTSKFWSTLFYLYVLFTVVFPSISFIAHTKLQRSYRGLCFMVTLCRHLAK